MPINELKQNYRSLLRILWSGLCNYKHCFVNNRAEGKLNEAKVFVHLEALNVTDS